MQPPLSRRINLDGFNAGGVIDDPVMHARIHVISRYTGDVQNPRDGIQHVMPGEGEYWATGTRHPNG